MTMSEARENPKASDPADQAASPQAARLQARIEAARARNAARSVSNAARQGAIQARDFVREHPLVTLAGAATVGIALGMMTKPGRALAGRGKALAAMAGQIALTMAGEAASKARRAAMTGKDQAEDVSAAISNQLREGIAQGEYLGERARIKASSLSRRAVSTARRGLRSVRERAG